MSVSYVSSVSSNFPPPPPPEQEAEDILASLEYMFTNSQGGTPNPETVEGLIKQLDSDMRGLTGEAKQLLESIREKLFPHGGDKADVDNLMQALKNGTLATFISDIAKFDSLHPV